MCTQFRQLAPVPVVDGQDIPPAVSLTGGPKRRHPTAAPPRHDSSPRQVAQCRSERRIFFRLVGCHVWPPADLPYMTAKCAAGDRSPNRLGRAASLLGAAGGHAVHGCDRAGRQLRHELSYVPPLIAKPGARLRPGHRVGGARDLPTSAQPMMWPPPDAVAVSTTLGCRSGDAVASFIRGSRRKIRTIGGPAPDRRLRPPPFCLFSMGAAAVPPADEELAVRCGTLTRRPWCYSVGTAGCSLYSRARAAH